MIIKTVYIEILNNPRLSVTSKENTKSKKKIKKKLSKKHYLSEMNDSATCGSKKCE